MEPTRDAAAPAPAPAGNGGGAPLPLRIFVGGVGPTVTAADLEKTFSPMGRLAGVDIVRTNGRSFAYMDFHPASDRALAKLFSTYNGCIWKGGKLKLEKAKEHYLTRLKKEWEEEANLVSTTPVNPIPVKNTGPLKKLDLLKQENMQLKIFFPNLRKVKSVPFKGTGKHKYSFQRIEVPPLPIHFCDCEEHSGSYELSSKKYQSPFDKVINEKELHVMNSVMNKLLEKENNKKTATEKTLNLSRDASILDSIDDVLPEEVEEDQGTDEDNLVTNIGMGGSNDILMHGRQTHPLHQGTTSRKLKPSKDRSLQNKPISEKRKTSGPNRASEVAPDKRFHPMLVEKITEDEFTPILSRKIHFQEPDFVEKFPPVKSQTELNSDTFESRKGNSWLQKSTWTDLVGKNDSSLFSITDHLPDTNSLAPKKAKTKDLDISVSTSAKKRKVQSGSDMDLKKTAGMKRKAISDKEESSSQSVSQNIVLEKATALNCVEISKEGVGKANSKDVIETPAKVDAEHKKIEDESMPLLPNTIISGAHFQEPKVVTEDPPAPGTHTAPAEKVNTWYQNFSWKDLVADKTSNSFTFSSHLPNIFKPDTNLPKTSNSPFTISTTATGMKAQPDEDKSNPLQSRQNTQKEKAVVPLHVENTELKEETLANHVRREARENVEVVAKRATPKIVSSKGSTFMRSEESLKEWQTVKQALSGFITNKNNGKNASKSSKGIPSWKGAPKSSKDMPFGKR